MTMQVFQEVQKHFHSMGFDPGLKPFNGQILSYLVTSIPTVVFLWIFLIHEANGAQQYMESIYMVNTSTGVLICFISTIFNSTKVFSFIQNDEKIVNESK